MYSHHLLRLLTVCRQVPRLSSKPPSGSVRPAERPVWRVITASFLFILASALTATAAPPVITTPVQIGAWPGFSRGGFLAVAVSDRFAYAAIGGGGLVILDISTPANPIMLSRFQTSGSASGVQVVGKFAYVADGSAGLQIIDVSNPANPVRLGGFDTSGSAVSVQVVANMAYVADALAGLQVIDVSNPASPVRLGGFDTSGIARGLQVVGNLAYVADHTAGLQIIDVTLH